MTQPPLAWYGFGRTSTIGAKRLQRLRLLFEENIESAWSAPIEQLRKAIGEKAALRFDQERQQIDLQEEANLCRKQDIHLLTIHDKRYPDLLAQTHDPPSVLYYKGDLAALEQPCVSMVGTRKASAYGRQVATDIATDLARAQWTTVSGLAFGIDITCHRASVASGGRTIAVLPGGLDPLSLAPATHAQDAQQIVEHGGLLLSEYAPGTQAFKGHFSVRNRLIAGLSHVTVVVEARLASGTMITARAALAENRELCAVPGSVNSLTSQAPHQLIKEGAALVTSAQDIMETLSLDYIPPVQETANLSEEETTLMNLIGPESTPIDEVVRASSYPTSRVMSLLTQLELQGWIQPAGAGSVRRAKT